MRLPGAGRSHAARQRCTTASIRVKTRRRRPRAAAIPSGVQRLTLPHRHAPGRAKPPRPPRDDARRAAPARRLRDRLLRPRPRHRRPAHPLLRRPRLVPGLRILRFVEQTPEPLPISSTVDDRTWDRIGKANEVKLLVVCAHNHERDGVPRPAARRGAARTDSYGPPCTPEGRSGRPVPGRRLAIRGRSWASGRRTPAAGRAS
jgi:hypothetical protein